MGIYTCAFCDKQIDDDYEPCVEYGKYLICPHCAEEVEDGTRDTSEMKMEDEAND